MLSLCITGRGWNDARFIGHSEQHTQSIYPILLLKDLQLETEFTYNSSVKLLFCL